MNISYYPNPFPYSIIDDFFDSEMLKKVTKHTSEMDIGLKKFDPELEKDIRNTFSKTLLDIRQELLKTMVDAWEHDDSPEDYMIWSNKMQPDTVYKVHQDSTWKRLSLVIYIGKDNAGTLFHKSETINTPIGEVEWKHNRGFAFVPGENTWHSYRNIRNYPRETVLINMGPANHPVFSEENSHKY
ncbi:MAG: hypothetical protein CBB97_10295 [Candidatus Endolissoclinum sp. TMED37]|nr:MAG: hypothetical protein CBB97_10295 [Candidatus Endolissoclinum sp. TMED37]|tara:strand:+ start:171 stop:725 length:555 start_codon:yes stop_codon:yes gene_type:complete